MSASELDLPASPPREGVLRRLRRLTAAEAWAFARAWLVLLGVDLGLRLLPFRRLERWLAPPVPEMAEEEVVPDLVWATAAAARHHLYPMRCLPRALCLRWLLGRHGIAAELRIGVERRRGELRAHAWVEKGGVPLGEGPGVADRWVPLDPA